MVRIDGEPVAPRRLRGKAGEELFWRFEPATAALAHEV